MNPNACVKSLNSNVRCRFPFTTLQPLSLLSPTATCCFDSLPLLMDLPVPFVCFDIISLSVRYGRRQRNPPTRYTTTRISRTVPTIPRPPPVPHLEYP